MSLAELRPAAVTDNTPTADELIIRARALTPRLRERGVKAERDRNIPQQSVDEYLASGLIHTLQPKRWGGYEHDHEVAFDIAIELGKSTCGSSAWCLNYLADHACILAHFPEEAQHDVWSRDTAACIATSAAPTGKVAVAPGGYRLDGRWSWCSGLRHSQWIMIGGLVFREGEDHPDMRLFVVPVAQVKQEDTWYCAGLTASGSNTSVLDNVFVPEHRSVSFATLRDARSPGSKLNTNPIYRTPFIAVHTYALLGPALGLARGGYADFVQWTRQRMVPIGAQGHDDHSARDPCALASRWISPILALEIPLHRRPATNPCGIAGVDLANERGQSALGCTAHSWGIAQARLCGGSVDRRQVHGQEGRPVRPELGHVPAQSYAAHRGHGFVRGSDHRLYPALRSGHCPVGSARACLDQCDRAPDG